MVPGDHEDKVSQFDQPRFSRTSQFLRTSRPRQNGRHFPDNIFKCIFLNESVSIAIEISLNFVPNGPINYNPVLVKIMAWRQLGDKPLSEPMMVSLLTHTCVTRPQWVKDIQPEKRSWCMSCIKATWTPYQGNGLYDGLGQEKRNSSALAMELCLSCINPSILSLPTSTLCTHHHNVRSVVPEAGIKGRDKSLHPIVSVRCNYLFLPLIPASGTTEAGIEGMEK